MINNYPVDLETNLNISLVCIDNEIIRNQIKNSSKIKINSVPSLLIIQPSGEISLYENQSVVQWFNEQISNNPQLHPPKPQPPPQPKPPPPPPPQHHSEPETSPKPIEEDNTNNLEQNIPPKKPNSSQKTSIENINLDEKFDESITRPPVAMRNNEGGYDLSNDFGEPESPNRDMTKHTKTNTQPTTGPSDLMSQALAMQKEREKGEPKNPLNPTNT
jgi:hypothetical protein